MVGDEEAKTKNNILGKQQPRNTKKSIHRPNMDSNKPSNNNTNNGNNTQKHTRINTNHTIPNNIRTNNNNTPTMEETTKMKKKQQETTNDNTEEQETTPEIITKEPNQRDLTSEATEKRILLKKYKKMMGEAQKLADFKEPTAILMRRSGQGEWYENVTKGKFNYNHSDGTDRFIIIKGKPLDMKYADRSFKMYILHEDFPLPLPEDPLITTEEMANLLESALSSTAKLRAKEWSGKTNFVKMLVIGIAVIIAGIILYKILVPNNPQTAITTTKTVVQNITTIA